MNSCVRRVKGPEKGAQGAFEGVRRQRSCQHPRQKDIYIYIHVCGRDL